MLWNVDLTARVPLKGTIAHLSQSQQVVPFYVSSYILAASIGFCQYLDVHIHSSDYMQLYSYKRKIKVKIDIRYSVFDLFSGKLLPLLQGRRETF